MISHVRAIVKGLPHVFSVLSHQGGIDPFAGNRILREEIHRAGLQITELSKLTGVNRSTLSSWVNNRIKLRYTNRRQRDDVTKVCSYLGVDPSRIWEVAATSAVGETRAPYPGVHIAEILLDTLEDPNSPSDRKWAARMAILEWVKQAHR